jgi:hypothetical protein
VDLAALPILPLSDRAWAANAARAATCLVHGSKIVDLPVAVAFAHTICGYLQTGIPVADVANWTHANYTLTSMDDAYGNVRAAIRAYCPQYD